MLSRFFWIIAAFVSVCSPAPVTGQSHFMLREGDRVVFYGDSITAQRLYSRFTEDIIVSRYPNLHLAFYNAGVSGDTVSGGHAGDMETRVKRDVVPWHPTVVTLMLGMNDGGYTADVNAHLREYSDGYRKLIATLRALLPGVRLVLICPSPYDEVSRPSLIPGYGDVIRRYGQFVTSLGKEEGIPVIDLNTPMEDAIKQGMAIDPQMAGALLPDRIHPSPAGHWVMATALAEGLKIDPVVSSVTIHLPGGTADETYRSAVTEIHAAQDGLTWTQLDQAVPLPLELNDPSVQFLLRISDLGKIDRQILRVTGLASEHYTLYIDSGKIGTFTKGELAAGVNLAEVQTPMEQQAKSIDWTADDRAKLSGTRFDLLTQEPPVDQRIEGLGALDSLDERMITQEYENARPKAHVFRLVPEIQ
jgi:lysophospholipase L1-like esterase